MLEDESTSGPECSRKDYVNDKFQGHHRESKVKGGKKGKERAEEPREESLFLYNWRLK